MEIVIEKWTGRLVGKMHNERINAEDVASEMGVTPGYVSMILNGKRNPPGAKVRMEQAVDLIIQKRKAGKEHKYAKKDTD